MTHQDEQDKDDAVDAIDALRSELKRVPLSPEFTARLRQRIDAAPDARGVAWLSGWRWLVPAASAAAVVVAAFALSWSRPAPPQQVTARAPIETPTVVAIEPENLRTSTFAKAPADRREPENLRTSTFAKAPADRREPENPSLEVITNQPAILRALWARAGRGPAVVEVPMTQMPDPNPEIVVPPIEVSPIVVKPLEPQPAPGVLPIVR